MSKKLEARKNSQDLKVEHIRGTKLIQIGTDLFSILDARKISRRIYKVCEWADEYNYRNGHWSPGKNAEAEES